MGTEPTWPDRSWVTTAELAAIAGVAEKTIYREMQRDHLVATKAGRQWSIERPEAERWLAAYNQSGPNPGDVLNPPAPGVCTMPSS